MLMEQNKGYWHNMRSTIWSSCGQTCDFDFMQNCTNCLIYEITRHPRESTVTMEHYKCRA